MGKLSSIVSDLNTLNDVVGAVSGITSAVSGAFGVVDDLTNDPEDDRRKALRAQHDLALKQLKAQQRLEETNTKKRAALERDKLAAETERLESERRAALRRAVARQRASFSAHGVGAQDGSSEAVLLGLFEETEDDKTERARLEKFRNRAINQDLSRQRRINVLQRSQLKERQRLERLVEQG